MGGNWQDILPIDGLVKETFENIGEGEGVQSSIKNLEKYFEHRLKGGPVWFQYFFNQEVLATIESYANLHRKDFIYLDDMVDKGVYRLNSPIGPIDFPKNWDVFSFFAQDEPGRQCLTLTGDASRYHLVQVLRNIYPKTQDAVFISTDKGLLLYLVKQDNLKVCLDLMKKLNTQHTQDYGQQKPAA